MKTNKETKNIVDYIDEGMLYIDMKKQAANLMRNSHKYEEMMMVVYSLLAGMINELDSRDERYMNQNEAKSVKRMLEFLGSLMDSVEKNK